MVGSIEQFEEETTLRDNNQLQYDFFVLLRVEIQFLTRPKISESSPPINYR